MHFLLELLAEVLGFIAEPIFEWIVRACYGVCKATIEVVRYWRLEREEKDRNRLKKAAALANGEPGHRLGSDRGT